MEQLNRVELRGIVGSIKLPKIGDRSVARFTLTTNLLYRDSIGTPIIETTWHDVTAWESNKMPNLEDIKKGSKVHLVGRIRNMRYTTSDGETRYRTEILANTLTIIDSKEELVCEQ